jgi:hypothetical protein
MGGLLRWYTRVWWFDHLTHFASATLVASIGFTLARAYESRIGHGAGRATPARTAVPRWFVPAFTVAFVMAAGYAWEVFETYTPLLTVYGPNDTYWDYVFDLLGGIAVVALGDRLLAEPAEQLAGRLEEVGIDLPVPATIDSGRSR